VGREPHQAVLFDLFDTLCRIDETGYRVGKGREAALLGLPADAFSSAWIATGEAAQTGRLPDIEARVRAAAAALDRFPDEVTVRRVVRLEEEMMTAGTSLYPDVLPTLDRLRARVGLRIGLVSNASSTAALLFERLGLARFFDHAAFSFRVGVLKPDPGIYLSACAALAVEPRRCLFVGDGNGRELDGARALGMESVRIERPLAGGPYRKNPSRTFDASVGDLTRVVDLVRG
jgi:putative hydrolase of the HAD superfamily